MGSTVTAIQADIAVVTRLARSVSSRVGSKPGSGLELAKGLRTEAIYEKKLEQLKRLMSESKYTIAVSVGRDAWLAGALEMDSPYFLTLHAELGVHYALALIYTGEPEKGIEILKNIIAKLKDGPRPGDVAAQSDRYTIEGSKRNWVLGRAHNNLGYAYWMERGQYRLALEEFHAALPYFPASDWLEEWANTNDNMGRVYALLLKRGQAEQYMNSALELRRQLKQDYRMALSLNSRAIAHTIFGEPEQARRLSQEALDIFEKLEKKRGIGLASITLGGSQRRLGNLTNLSYEERMTLLNQARTNLERAVNIFAQAVQEPVRLIEARKELGCTLGDQARLAPQGISKIELVAQAIEHLESAARLAKGKNDVLYVDACVALAQTYFDCGQFNKAERCLLSAECVIPDTYRITDGSELCDIPMDKCIEGFWRQMSEIESIRGNIARARGLGNNGQVSHEALAQAKLHQTSAQVYLNHFLELEVDDRF